MCKRIFNFELQLSSYWQNIKFSWYCPKFHIFTKIIIFQVYLQLFRPTASSLYILWQGYVRNTLFHFCQLWAVIFYKVVLDLDSCVLPGTIEQGDWKQTIDHYCIIIYEHTMLVVGVFLSEKLKICLIMFQNRTKMTFSPNTWAYIKLNTILMRFFKIKCCCSDWNNWYIWEKCDKLRCMIEC